MLTLPPTLHLPLDHHRYTSSCTIVNDKFFLMTYPTKRKAAFKSTSGRQAELVLGGPPSSPKATHHETQLGHPDDSYTLSSMGDVSLSEGYVLMPAASTSAFPASSSSLKSAQELNLLPLYVTPSERKPSFLSGEDSATSTLSHRRDRSLKLKHSRPPLQAQSKAGVLRSRVSKTSRNTASSFVSPNSILRTSDSTSPTRAMIT
jgi:hypothetical protein